MHHTLCKDRPDDGVCLTQMKKRRDLKAQEEANRSRTGTPSRCPPLSKCPVPTAESNQLLRGGPKTWPPEVVEHVKSLVDLGWSSGKVVNHYSLVAFGLTPAQVDLVRNLPAPRRASPADGSADIFSDELVQQIRRLILEGKTDTAIRNHYCLSDATASEVLIDSQIQSVRTAIEKEAWSSADLAVSPLRKSASKIKPPSLSPKEKALIEQLICEGRSNAYICNFHSLCDLQLQEFQVEGVRRAFNDEQDGVAVITARRSPPQKQPDSTAYSSDDDERLKKAHKERLRRKTAEKMMKQRLLASHTAAVH